MRFFTNTQNHKVLSSMPLCTPSLNRSKLPVYFITWKNKTDITSAADAQEVGWLQNGPPNKTLTHVVQKILPRLCSSCLFYTVNAQLICNVLQFLNLFWRSHDDFTARRKQPSSPYSLTPDDHNSDTPQSTSTWSCDVTGVT